VSEIAIEVDSVSKRYRLFTERNQSLKAWALRKRRSTYEEFWALQDVSIEIPTGSTFGLIGANGSGKSTLLKCIAQILRPDKGEIRSHGSMSALLELGAGFHPELSGRDNVFLNGSILGLGRKEVEARFDDIVDFAGIGGFIDSPVKNYSSGMYVRLGFSIAINVSPDILLVDEVLAVGDVTFQRRCAEKFDELRGQGRTVVLVSHSLGSVRSLCDRVALLEGGKLRAVGEAGQVIDEYLAEPGTSMVADGAHGVRWGSGEARIDDVEILGPDGRPRDPLATGEPATFRIHFTAHEPIAKPIIRLELHNSEGAVVTAPNTDLSGQVPDVVDGSGYVDLEVDRLLLAPGWYDLSATFFDGTYHPYDVRQHAFRFDVELGSINEPYGITSLGGRWTGPDLPPPSSTSSR
jgi:ABC-type polysaccharide/polyol phosphate transport system ATPase subunit